MKKFKKAVMLGVKLGILVTAIVWAIFGVRFCLGLREASLDRAYVYAEFFADTPKLKEMLKEAMVDGILTKNEYNRIKAEHEKDKAAKKAKEEEAKLLKARANLIESLYGKEEKK